MIEKRKKKKPTLKAIKRKADQIFSEYIRQLHADKSGRTICVTCGDIKPWKEHQCGHYFPRNRLGTRFHDDNSHPQCVGCNIFRKGNYTSYAAYMYNRYGKDKMEYMESLSRKTLKLSVSDYQTMIAGWRQLIDRGLNETNP